MVVNDWMLLWTFSLPLLFENMTGGNPVKKPDFNTWLFERTGHTCGELHDLALATGNYKSYEKMIAWYRNRYQLEVVNPFID